MHSCFYSLNDLLCADVPLRNYSLAHSLHIHHQLILALSVHLHLLAMTPAVYYAASHTAGTGVYTVSQKNLERVTVKTDW